MRSFAYEKIRTAAAIGTFARIAAHPATEALAGIDACGDNGADVSVYAFMSATTNECKSVKKNKGEKVGKSKNVDDDVSKDTAVNSGKPVTMYR